ncbi:hypothetical protein DE146DRAFT_765241 [Phaeosphaeria sp. MPI-PUGE-AT-0046c]|nr:hypothetical protein DE146DRAFT_765241 [Phaeosphaeria sp. MPI-PUGE-AT-0046c]
MDSQHIPAIPASYKRPSSDEINNSSAYTISKHGQAHFPLPLDTRATTHGFSPPYELQEVHQGLLHHEHLYNAATPSAAGRHYPPTPPMRDADYDALQRWNERQRHEIERSPMRFPHDNAYSTTYLQNNHPKGHPYLTTCGSWSPAEQAPCTRPPNYPAHGTQYHSQQDSYLDAAAQAYKRYLMAQQMPPPHTSFHGRTHPTYGPPEVAAASPPMQQWPTCTLAQQPQVSLPSDSHCGLTSAASAAGPSSGHDGRSPLDKKTMKKMAKYEKKAAHRRASLPSQEGISPRPVARKRGTKGQNHLQQPDHVAATPPPSCRSTSAQVDPLRHSPHIQPGTYGYAVGNLPHQHVYTAFSPYNAVPPAYTPAAGPSHQPHVLGKIGTPSKVPISWSSEHTSRHTIANNMSLDVPASTPHNEPVFRPRKRSGSPMMGPVDWDAMHLPIARDYDDFKYSVYHYEVQTSAGYQYAQSWLEDLLNTNLEFGEHKWHAHTSPGFIFNGTRLSVLVLHNAVNPFEWNDTADSSTTMGVYGIEHDEIHWKTVAPGIKWIIDYSATPEVNTLALQQQWTCQERKASERRFHKAYWHAAARVPLRGMLNRGDVDADPLVISDVDYEYPFGFTPEDLTSEWENSGWECSIEEAECAWKRVVREMEGWDWGEGEFVVTGSSEWE